MKETIKKFTQSLKTLNKSDSTIIAYKKDLEQLVEYLEKTSVPSFKAVNDKILNEYVKELTDNGKFSLKTVSRKINSLKTFFKYLQKENIISTNPSEKIKHPKLESKLPRILTTQEYMALRESTRNNTRIYSLVEILLQTGMRIGEISRLTVDDIYTKGKRHFIKIAGFGSFPEREIEITDNMKALVDKLISIRSPKAKTNYLFTTKTGKNLLIRNMRSAIDRHFKKLDIDKVAVNDLRNSFIVYQLRYGVDPKFLSEYAGHQRLSSTYKYIKQFKIENIGNKRKIVEL